MSNKGNKVHDMELEAGSGEFSEEDEQLARKPKEHSQKQGRSKQQIESGDSADAAAENEDLGLLNEEEERSGELDEEEEEEGEDADDYVEDGFVVGDDEDDSDEDEDYGENQGSGDDDDYDVNEGHRQKKKKKKLRKKANLEPDLEDLELIEENKQMQKHKISKLKKKSDADIDEENASDDFDQNYSQSQDNQDQMEFADDSQNIQKTKHRKHQKKANIQDPEEAYDQVNEDDLQYMKEKLVDPEEIQQQYSLEEDTIIAQKDVPERLQLKYQNQDQSNLEDQIHESQWIYLMLMYKEQNEHLKLKQIIKKIIEFMQQKESLDVMHIINYKQNIYHPEMKESDILQIYKLDGEWEHFHKIYKRVVQVIQNYKTLSNQALLRKIDVVQDNSIDEKTIDLIYKVQILQDWKEYCEFQLIKLICEIRYQMKVEMQSQQQEQLANSEEDAITKNFLENNKYKSIIKSRYNQLDKWIQYGLHEKVRSFTLTPEQFAINIKQNKMVYVPTNPLKTPEKEAESLLNENVLFLKKTLTVLESLCWFEANNLFNHPYIRQHVLEKFKQTAYFSTNVTPKGKSTLNIYHKLYYAKICQNKKIGNFLKDEAKSDKWLLIQKAKKEGFITIEFHLESKSSDRKSNQDKKPKNQHDIYRHIKLLPDHFYLYGSQNNERELDEFIKQWDVMRLEIIDKLLDKLVVWCQRQVAKELQELSEKDVLKKCKIQFDQMIMAPPYVARKVVNKKQVQDKPSVLSIAVDDDLKAGIAYLNKEGEVLQQWEMNNLVRSILDTRRLNYPKEHQPYRNQQKPQPIQLTQLDKMDLDVFESILISKRPDLITITANHPDVQEVKRYINDIKQKENLDECWVSLADDMVPQIVAKKELLGNQINKEMSYLIKVAISLGRMKQNPIAEIANLWDERVEKNKCLLLPFHYLQNEVKQGMLKDELELALIHRVNQIGVDINAVINHQHLDGLVQFINGLGPRMAKRLLEKLRGECAEILNREQLKDKYLSKNIYYNAVPFIKIAHENQEILLDRTRIHPEFYSMAKKIAKDAQDDTQEPANTSKQNQDRFDQNQIIRMISERSDLLDNLDLEEYSEHLAKDKKKENMLPILQFIQKELAHPYCDPRFRKTDDDSTEMSDVQLFYKLIKETPETFDKWKIVTGKVVFVNELTDNFRNDNIRDPEKIYIIQLNNYIKLRGSLKQSEIDTYFKKVLNINKKITLTRGTQLSAYVKWDYGRQFNYPQRDNQYPGNKENSFYMRVPLTLLLDEDSALRKWQPHASKEKEKRHWDVVIDPNDFVRLDLQHLDADYQKNLQLNKSNMQNIKKIFHPQYKQISLKQAVEYLKNKPDGEFLFRPSQSNKNSINITWKFYKDVIAHIAITEEKQPYQPNQNLYNQPLFKIGSETYVSLDEIINRYILPSNVMMQAVASHKKFLNKTFDQIHQQLKDDKAKDSSTISYYFGTSPDYPTYIVLMYLTNNNLLMKEFIRVNIYGLKFHEHYFNSLPDLIQWFKSNYKEDSYRKFVKKVLPPMAISKKETQMQQNVKVKMEKSHGGIKSEHPVKYENLNNSIIRCNKCHKVGHSANQCYSHKRDSQERSRSRDNDKDSERYSNQNRMQNRNPQNDFAEQNAPIAQGQEHIQGGGLIAGNIQVPNLLNPRDQPNANLGQQNFQ